MKKGWFLSFLLLALASQARAQTAPADIAVVRLRDAGAVVEAFVTRGEGKTEQVKFTSGSSDNNLRLSSEGYYKLFQQLYREGYQLQSTFSNENGTFTTLLFVKK